MIKELKKEELKFDSREVKLIEFFRCFSAHEADYICRLLKRDMVERGTWLHSVDDCPDEAKDPKDVLKSNFDFVRNIYRKLNVLVSLYDSDCPEK